MKLSKLWESSLVMTAAGLVGGALGYVFQAIIGARLDKTTAEFANVATATSFVGFLLLPMQIASWAVVNSLARFQAGGDTDRLRSLLNGSRTALFRLTLAGSLLALAVIGPLGRYFHFRPSLMVAAFVFLLINAWATYFYAIAQGLGWFRLLAVFGVIVALGKAAFAYVVTFWFQTAEIGMWASAVGALCAFGLLFWWREMFTPGRKIPVFTREFFHYLLIAAAIIGGSYFFFNGDKLALQKYIPDSDPDKDGYAAAGTVTSALLAAVSPVLTVLFVTRSGAQDQKGAGGQLTLLAVYAAGLLAGAAGLYFTRDLSLRLLHKYSPEAAAKMLSLGLTMVFVGLLQAIGMWALASRWWKVCLLFGVLGAIYWAVLMTCGTTMASLLYLMPVLSGASFVVLTIAWVWVMKKQPATNLAEFK